MKIRTKLQIRFFGIAFLLAISLMSIVYFSMVPHFEQQEGNRLKDNILESAKDIDNFMLARVKDFTLLSNNPLFSISSAEITSNYLSRVVEQYPFYEQIFIVDKDAIVISSSSQALIGLNIINIDPDIEEEFHKALKGENDDVYISDIAKVSQKEIKGNSPLDIELLSNVIDLNGNVIGVLVGFVDIQFIKDIVNDINKRTIGDEYIYLVNEPGDILISANPEIKILKPHSDLPIKNLQQKREGDETGFMIYQNSKGIKVISGYADLSEYGTDKIGDWSLLLEAPYGIIMNPIYKMLYKVFFSFAFILAFIFILTVEFSRSLSKPIIKLQKVVSEFDMDSKPIELKIGKNDEVRSLSKSFNTMTKKLYKSSEERKITEKALRESKEKFRTYVEESAFSLFVNNFEGKIVDVNQNSCDSLGYTKKELLSMNVLDIDIAYDLKKAQAFWSKIQPKQKSQFIGQHRRKDGTIFSIEGSVGCYDLNGERFYLGQAYDITPRIKAEEELTKYRKNLEEIVNERTLELGNSQEALLNLVDDLNIQTKKLKDTNKMLANMNAEMETFTYSVSHDLKAPLRGIDGYSNLLYSKYKDKLDEEALDFLTNIKNGTGQMNVLIEDLLAYSRMEREEFELAEINLKTLVDNILLNYSETIKIQNIKINCTFNDVFLLQTDKKGLTVVMRNLIENAIKFSKPNKQSEIEIGGFENEEKWHIFVKDNGIGFDMKYHDRIYKIFQRLHLQEEYGGTGIGLAMVYKAIQRMSGKVWAKSTLNNGACFYIEIYKNNYNAN